MIWSMATPHWSWDKILDSVGAGKMILPEQKPWMDKSHFEKKDYANKPN